MRRGRRCGHGQAPLQALSSQAASPRSESRAGSRPAGAHPEDPRIRGRNCSELEGREPTPPAVSRFKPEAFRRGRAAAGSGRAIAGRARLVADRRKPYDPAVAATDGTPHSAAFDLDAPYVVASPRRCLVASPFHDCVWPLSGSSVTRRMRTSALLSEACGSRPRSTSSCRQPVAILLGQQAVTRPAPLGVPYVWVDRCLSASTARGSSRGSTAGSDQPPAQCRGHVRRRRPIPVSAMRPGDFVLQRPRPRGPLRRPRPDDPRAAVGPERRDRGARRTVLPAGRRTADHGVLSGL